MRTAILVYFILIYGFVFAQKPTLISRQEGHSIAVEHTCFSLDERLALSADLYKIVLWDLPSSKFVRSIQTEEPATFLSFDETGQQAVAVLSDTSMNAWNLATGERMWHIQLPAMPLAVTISPDKKYVAASFDSLSIDCWELSSHEKIWSRPLPDQGAVYLYFELDGLAVSARDAAGKSLGSWASISGAAVPQAPDRFTIPGGLKSIGNQQALVKSKQQLQFFDFQMGFSATLPALLETMNESMMPLNDFVFSPDGSLLLVAMGEYTDYVLITPGMPGMGMGKGALLVWDATEDRLVHQMEGLSEMVTKLALSSDGSQCLSASLDKSVRLWDIQSGKERLRLEQQAAIETNFTFSQDFHKLAITNFYGAFKFWNLDQRSELDAYPPVSPILNALAMNDTGNKMLSASRDFSLNYWNTKNLDSLGQLKDRHQCLWVGTSLAIAPDGKTALVASTGEWRFMSQVEARPLPLDSIIDVIRDDRKDTIGIRTVAGTEYLGRFQFADTAVWLIPSFNSVSRWDLEKKQSLQAFEFESSPQTGLSELGFSPDGALGYGLGDTGYKIFDFEKNSPISFNGTDVFDALFLGSPRNKVAKIAADSLAYTISSWSSDPGGHETSIRIKCTSAIANICLSPTGNELCTVTKSGELLLRDIQTNTILKSLTGVDPGTSIQLGPNANTLVIWENGSVALWNLISGKKVLELGKSAPSGNPCDKFFEYHRAEEISLFRFLPNGFQAVSASYDGTLRIWDIFSGQERFTIFFSGEKDWVVTTPEGLFDASPGAMKSLYFIIGSEVIELEQLKDRYFEPGLLQKLLGYNPEEVRDVSTFTAVELYPKIKAAITDNHLNIELTARSGKLGKLSLFINGKEVAEDINTDLKTQVSIDLQDYARYYSPEENIIALRAYNSAGWMKSAAYSISYSPPARSRGTGSNNRRSSSIGNDKPALYAIFVGTSNYSGEQLDLRFPDLDAKAMASAILASGKPLFEERIHIKLLTSVSTTPEEVPSKANISAAFQEYAAQAKQGDILIAYFSGHGVTYGPAEKSQFYYLTKDMAAPDLKDPEVRDKFTISSDDITLWLTANPAKKQVLILDACNSGKAVEALAMIGARAASASQVRAIDRMKDRTGMFIITGSAADKLSFESPLYNQGLLTYSLLEGMSGMALSADNRVDVMTLFQFSRDKVPDLAKGIRETQTPVLAFPDGGQSFDIGIVEAGVIIPLAQAKKVFIRNNFQDEQWFDDRLGITQALNDQLQLVTVRALKASFIYLDIPAYEEAYSIKGRYSAKDGDIRVRTRVFKGKEPVGDEFTIVGKQDNIPAITKGILDKVLTLVNE